MIVPFTNKSRIKKLINPITIDFYDLKVIYPEKDEHWYLANAWLRRYKKQSKKDYKYYVLPDATIADIRFKDPDRLLSFAYIESHEFSILDSPESIEAFSYYLLYKEAPKLCTIVADRYKKLTERTFELKESKEFFSVYKEKNQLTYNSISSDPDCDSYLKAFILTLEMEDGRRI